METVEQLDTDISDLNAHIATLRAHRANLASILYSQPHLAARLRHDDQRDKSAKTAQETIVQQSKRNTENIYRACAGVTAYKVKDPDPHAENNGNILGVSVDVSVGSKFVETYHVLLKIIERSGERVLKIHKHTIPPCVPLQQLANRWLPVSGKEAEGATDPEQDLIRFGRTLRKELVSWHMRVKAVEDLKKEAGITSSRRDEQERSSEDTMKVLNAFVSDDEDSSDVEDADGEAGAARILDIETDAAVRQLTITWSDIRTAIMTITKDGRVEKAICRTKDGGRDAALSRKAIGPLGGLLRRLNA
ncbi:Cenp-O kinetochore centromere component-domain-containing protein [Pyrenochaeta sp. MPI-SDFR-AT-0127]|nr:Cenp-O kinetochore centromere component-domain-containing protein [Pyrenochaeta sp. MPI-SDFR-AT-0127]